MSFQSFDRLLEAAAKNGGNVFIIADSVNLHLHVDRVPKSVSVDVLPKEKEAEEPLDDAMRRKLADVTADARELDAKPGHGEKLLAAAYIRGNLTQAKLVEFAPVAGFTKEAADRLWGMLHGEEFIAFLAGRGVTLEEGKDGNSLRMSGVRKAAALEDLKPGCVPNFGKTLYQLLLATAAR